MLTLERRHDAGRVAVSASRTRKALPVLIQVPAIETESRGYASRRPSATHIRAKKRRLRREVKLVGMGFLLSLPVVAVMSLVLVQLGTNTNSTMPKVEFSGQANSVDSGLSFGISVEPISSPSSVSASSPASVESIPCISLQGFVLPDREVEESNHAGG